MTLAHTRVEERRGNEVQDQGEAVRSLERDRRRRNEHWRCRLSVASATAATAKKSTVVHISVVSLIPGSTQAAFNEFDNKVAEFEAANPGISVRGVQYQWLPATFAAKLASGTLPTVFTVPFTDGRSLGNNGQLANLTKYAEAEPYYKDFNPAVIAEGIDSKKQVIAIPDSRLCAGAELQPPAVQRGGPQPQQAPDNLGAARG